MTVIASPGMIPAHGDMAIGKHGARENRCCALNDVPQPIALVTNGSRLRSPYWGEALRLAFFKHIPGW